MSILAEDDRLSYRVLFLLAVVVLLALPVPVLRIFGTLVILCYLPAAPFAARTGLSFVSALGITVVLSPVLIALPVMAVISLNLPVEMAVWAIIGIAMAQFLVYGTQGGMSVKPADRKLLLAMLALLALCAFLCLWLPSTNSMWRYRADSWFHAAVLNRLAGHSLPAVDPYFSPLRLQYTYFYHVLLLVVSTLTGLNPFFTMIVTNFIALAGCLFGFSFLAGRFTQSGIVRWLGTCLFVFGMNGLFYIFFPIRITRAFLGETSGIAILEHSFTLSPPGLETATRFLSIENNQFMFLEKFMLGTALTLTLGLVCVVLALIVMSRRGGWSWISLFLYAIGICGVLFLHLVIGITMVVATVITIVVSLIFRGPQSGKEHYYQMLLQGAITVGAVAMSFPYIRSIQPDSGVGGVFGFALQTQQVIGALACALPVLVPSVWFLFRGEYAVRPGGGLSASGAIAVWASVFVLAAVVIDLPARGEILFSFPLHIALSALAVGALDHWMTRGTYRRALVTWIYVLLCTVPLNTVFFTSAFRDKSEFVITRTESSLYNWIKKFSPKEALYLEADDIVRIPVLAARDLYWGSEKYARLWRYPETEVTARRALRDAVFGDGEIPNELFRHAASLNRPLYVVLRDVHTDGGEQFKRISQHPRLTGKFMNDSIVVFEVDLRGF
jgi:hypothetical protein